MHRAQVYMVVILSMAALMDSLGYTLLLNVLPCMVDPLDSLHFNGVEKLNPGTAYSVLQFCFVFGATICPPFIGQLSDKFGRKLVLLLCLFLVACTYFLQSLATDFWTFAVARFLSGVSAGLRPVAIAYISDVVHEENLRCKLITSLSLVSAFSVGLGPAFGAHLASIDRSFPFIFVMLSSMLCFFLTLFFLPCSRDLCWGNPVLSSDDEFTCPDDKKKRIYNLLIFLGFSTYFMAMTASLAFPLSLKDVFELTSVQAGLCSVFDGPLIFATNFAFMHYSNTLSNSCKASVIASLLFCLIWWVPVTNQLPLFLCCKYITSIAGPIVFCTLPQILVSVCPPRICGKLAGLLTCFHGAGRLAASILVGPLFESNPAIVYRCVALTGLSSAIVFYLLLGRLEVYVGKIGIKTPLLCSPMTSRAPSRSISRIYAESGTLVPFGAIRDD